MSVRTYYFTDNKKWVDCILERDYCYNKKSFPASINIVDLSCRARAHKHPDDIFDEYFGKELSLAYAERDSANKKVKFLLKLSRKFSKEQKLIKAYKYANKFCYMSNGGDTKQYYNGSRIEYGPKIPKPKFIKQFKSRLTKLNEEDLELIYQGLEELHKKDKKKW